MEKGLFSKLIQDFKQQIIVNENRETERNEQFKGDLGYLVR